MTLERRLGEALDRTEEYILARDYRGYDPYDGLMSPLWSWPGFRRWHLPRHHPSPLWPFRLRYSLNLRQPMCDEFFRENTTDYNKSSCASRRINRCSMRFSLRIRRRRC